MIEPMLAHNWEAQSRKMPWPCYVSPKLDGVRAITTVAEDGITCQSRKGKVWANPLVKNIEAGILELDVPSGTILDGEFYYHGWKCQRINGAMSVNSKTPPSVDTYKIQYHVFDVVMPGSYRTRLYWMKDNLDDTQFIKVVPALLVKQGEVADSLYEKFLEDGYEGIMYRDPDSPYEHKRTCSILKRKDHIDIEVVMYEMVEGFGKHAGRMGAVTCRLGNGKIVSVGTGFTDEEREDAWDNWEDWWLGKKLTISFLNWTEEGIPRHPRAKMVREDI